MFLEIGLSVALAVAVVVAVNFYQLHADAEKDLADVLAMLGVAE